MGKFWTGQMKGLALYLTGLLCMMILLCNFLWNWESRQFGRMYADIVGNIKASYPEVEEEQIIHILSGQGNTELGEAVLEHYGLFFQESGAGRWIQGYGAERVRRMGNLALFLLAAGILGGVLVSQVRRRKKLARLCSYMDRISHGNFELQAEDNREDELSGLRNELYKLTVFYKKQAERATDNRKALADAVADISHQLKTPLTSMVVLADNLIESPDMEKETRQHFLQEIARQLGGMKWLVATMLKISRLDANVVTLEREPVEVRELTREVIQNLELGAQWKDVKISCRSESECQLIGDRKWLAEALSNIVKNAIEHSPQGGVVELIVQENDVYTQVEVRDQGEGISKEEQKHLFERFYQGAQAAWDNAGIGLALAKEIVEKHDGYITVESSAKGTSFFIKFIKCH